MSPLDAKLHGLGSLSFWVVFFMLSSFSCESHVIELNVLGFRVCHGFGQDPMPVDEV